MLAGTVRQLCQPPVLATAKLAATGPDGLSSRTWTRPLTPVAAPDATRPENWVTAVEEKSTLSYRSQSPLASQPTSWPPPVSDVDSVAAPAWALYASAWMVDRAFPPPPPPPPPPADGPKVIRYPQLWQGKVLVGSS